MLILLAIIFPWMYFLWEDRLLAALASLALQLSLIGWPIATIWAIRSYLQLRREERLEEEAIAAARAAKKVRSESTAVTPPGGKNEED